MGDAESDEGSVKREDDAEQHAEAPQEVADSAAAAGEKEDEEKAAEAERAAGTDAGEGGGEAEAELGGDAEGEEKESLPRLSVEEEKDGEAEEGASPVAQGEAEDGSGIRIEQIPDTGEVAEIILVTTSLGSIRRQFFSSQRTKNFLDCKGVVYIIVDSNRDTSTAKNWIFSRAACPNCLREKSLSALECEFCGVCFRNLIPPDYITEGHVLQMLQGCPYNEEEAGEAEGADKERRQQQRWGLSSQQSLAADVDLGDFEEEGEGGVEPEDAATSALQAAVKAEAEAEAAARRASMESAAAAAEAE